MSRLLKSIHSTAKGLSEAGVITKATMCKFDELFLPHIINNLIKGTKSYIHTPTERNSMITGEIKAEGQQPSELIKKIKENLIEITQNVCSKIIESFYNKFDIEKEVDDERLDACIKEASSQTDGVKELIACLNYTYLSGDLVLTPTTHSHILVAMQDRQFTLGKDILLDIFSTIVCCESTKGTKEWNHYLKIHYLVSKCLDLCVPF